jgi:hypothetical protein
VVFWGVRATTAGADCTATLTGLNGCPVSADSAASATTFPATAHPVGLLPHAIVADAATTVAPAVIDPPPAAASNPAPDPITAPASAPPPVAVAKLPQSQDPPVWSTYSA